MYAFYLLVINVAVFCAILKSRGCDCSEHCSSLVVVRYKNLNKRKKGRKNCLIVNLWLYIMFHFALLRMGWGGLLLYGIARKCSDLEKPGYEQELKLCICTVFGITKMECLLQ